MMIGVRAHDYGEQPVEELFSAISGDGWKSVQLAFPKAVSGVDSFDDVTPEILSRTKASLQNTGISAAVLGVYVDPSLTDEDQRKKQAGFLFRSLPQAAALNAGCVGTETTMRGSHSDISALYRSLEELLPEAERLGVNLGIEPVHIHTLHTPELARDMLRSFPSPSLKIIFDPINLLTLEAIDAQNDLWSRCIDCFGEYIVAVHIKGALGRADSNGMLADAPFSSSVVDYEFLFKLLHPLGVPVLREGATHEGAAADIAFLNGLVP